MEVLADTLNISPRPKTRRSLAQDICDELDAIAPGQAISDQRLIARRLVEQALMNPGAKVVALIASLTQQHRPFDETEIEEVDKEIMGRFGDHDPSAGEAKFAASFCQTKFAEKR